MLVTPNWTVNATAANAITAAATIPTPVACSNTPWLPFPDGKSRPPRRPGPRVRRDPGWCAAGYLMRGAISAAVMELTRARFPFGW